MEQEEITEGQSAELCTRLQRWKAEPIKPAARGVQTDSKEKSLNTNLNFFIEHNVFLLQLFFLFFTVNSNQANKTSIKYLNYNIISF